MAGALRELLPSSRGAGDELARELDGSAPPEAVAEALRGRPGFLWLDGGPGGHRLFTDPVATLTVRDGEARVRGPGGVLGLESGSLDLLDAALTAWGPCPGAVFAGFLGYEIAGELERLPPQPADDMGLPDLHLGLYDRRLQWNGERWSEHWAEELGGDPATAASLAVVAAPPPDPPGPLTRGAVTSRPKVRAYVDGVARTVARIHAGEIFQANLCRRLEAPFRREDTWALYRRLRGRSPAEHGALLDLGEQGAILSVSPERFLSVDGGRVESWPIKGTRPRGATPEADRALARELESSAKDRAELAMIVDLVRNDLGRVCRTGSVEVQRHAERITLPTVHHTRSVISGHLGAETGTADLLRATFPPGSITGAPKIQAMAVIAAEEKRRRGPAMGALGWIGLDGSLDLSVAIRTAVVARGRIAYHAGCGIVADSDPEDELEETRAKARAFLEALGCSEETT